MELVGQEARRDQVRIERRWNLVPWVWPRFAAKVALGALSLVMPPEWRGCDGELFLMALFRQGKVIGAANGLSAIPTPLELGDPFFDYIYPWEHVIVVDPTAAGVSVTLILFGELRYDLGVVSNVKPSSQTVWVCDHRENRPQRFASIAAFAAAITERAADWGDVQHLHLERPRGQLVGPVTRARLAETPLTEVGITVTDETEQRDTDTDESAEA